MPKKQSTKMGMEVSIKMSFRKCCRFWLNTSSFSSNSMRLKIMIGQWIKTCLKNISYAAWLMEVPKNKNI